MKFTSALATAVAAASASAFLYAYYKSCNQLSSSLSITISQLNIYPVKSCKGISVDHARITETGIENDRIYVIVDSSDGRFMSQRKCPKMATVKVELKWPSDDQPGVGALQGLILSGKDVKPIFVPRVEDAQKVPVGVWNDDLLGIDQGDQVSQWLSCYLQWENLRLLYFPRDQTRLTESDFLPDESSHKTAYSDGYPYLLASNESLDELNRRLRSKCSHQKPFMPLQMNRFRPNIVVNGCSYPFEEDSWRLIRVELSDSSSPIYFSPCKLCARCKIPTVNQETGEFSGQEPTETLKTFRKVQGEVFFGMNMVSADSQGEDIGKVLHVGDKIQVIQQKSWRFTWAMRYFPSLVFERLV